MATTTIPHINKNEDFVILKYKERFIISHLGYTTEYAIARPTPDGEMLSNKITKEKALRIIEENGLVKTFHNDDGTVYDRPGRDFKAKFENFKFKFPEVKDPVLKYNRTK